MIDFSSDFGKTARRHIDEEYFIWLTTVDSHLTPQPRPVWFIWEDDAFLIFSEPKAHKVKHIKANPRVALHFNTSDARGESNVIVFSGNAVIDSNAPSAQEVAAYFKKYQTGITDLKMTPDDFSRSYTVAIRIKPTSLRGW